LFSKRALDHVTTPRESIRNRGFNGFSGFSARSGPEDASWGKTTESTKSGESCHPALYRGFRGAIFKTRLDNTHPLAYGQGDAYFSLKTGTDIYQPIKGQWNVGTIPDQLLVAGFAGVHARNQMKNTLVFGVENKGAGKVVYLVDNPLFRGFWENGKFIFSNALFFVGN
jgi:hypothetical protein